MFGRGHAHGSAGKRQRADERRVVPRVETGLESGVEILRERIRFAPRSF